MFADIKALFKKDTDYTNKFSYDPHSLYDGFDASSHRIVRRTEPLEDDDRHRIEQSEDCFYLVITSASYKEGYKVMTKQVAVPVLSHPQQYFLLLNAGTNENEEITHDDPTRPYELIMDINRLASKNEPERVEGKFYIDEVYFEDMKAALKRKQPN